LKMFAHTRPHVCTMHHPAISSNLDECRIKVANCELIKALCCYPGRSGDAPDR
jgi:hypothetical protein